MRDRLVVRFVALVAFVSLAAALHAQPKFSVVEADPGRPGLMLYPSQNHVVRDSTGVLHVAYSQATTQAVKWYNFIRSSADGGNTWSPSVRTENFPDSSTLQSLVVGADDVLYEGYTFNVSAYFTRSTDSGASWAAPYTLHAAGGWNHQPSLVLDGAGALHAAYFAAFGWNDPPYNVEYATSTDAGATWAASADLTGLPNDDALGGGASSPVLFSGPEDQLFLLYAQAVAGGSELRLQHRVGGTWQAPVTVSNSDVLAYDLGVDSTGLVHVAFSRNDPVAATRSLFYTTYEPATRKVEAPVLISGDETLVNAVSVGVFQGDEVVVAYDRYDPIAKVYGGVLVRTSTDVFAVAGLLSTHPQARAPNLRAYHANFHQPEKQDVVWIEPSDETGGEQLAYTEISGGLPRITAVDVNTFGPYFMNPGQEVTWLVTYQNSLGEALEDAVVAVDVPQELQFVSASKGGLYKDNADRAEIVWKLGDVASDLGGSMSFRMYVPWGLPEMTTRIFSRIGARNHAQVMDVPYYLDWQPAVIGTAIDLDQAALAGVLEADAGLKALLDAVIAEGYVSEGVAQKTTFAGGKAVTRVFVHDATGLATILVSDGQTAYAERYEGTRYTRFDLNGSYTTDATDQSFVNTGTWAEHHSPDIASCQIYCTAALAPGWVAELASKAYGALSNSLDCAMCAKSLGKDPVSCPKCMMIYKNVPGVSHGLDVAACLRDCIEKPGLYNCSEEKRECTRTLLGRFCGFDTIAVTPCNTTIGKLGLFANQWISCATSDVCVAGQCVDENDMCARKPGSGAGGSGGSGEGGGMSSKSCKLDKNEIVPAHDPNAKHVDLKGNVIPGQELTYTIEFENTGAGQALGVFIFDTLSPLLDDSTLVLNDGGKYLSTARLASWEVGDLAPGQKGQVTFTIKVAATALQNDEIMNMAEVHFPSAGEVTPTNPVVNIVKEVTANPIEVQVEAGAAVPLTLSGASVGGKAVTFALQGGPVGGAIAGTAPGLTYTAAANFVGAEHLFYVASNGTKASDPASITVTVIPSASDVTGPSVVSTRPASSEKGVVPSEMPLAAEGGYLPLLTAVFDEPLDPASVSAASFVAGGVSGAVSYDATTRTLRFVPASPLTPATDYLVTITSVTDLRGNPMAAPLTYRFRTAAERELSADVGGVTGALEFGDVEPGSTAPYKVVSLRSSGLRAVTVGTVTLTGVNPSDFVITEDMCTGLVLEPGVNCHLRVTLTPGDEGLRTATLVVTSDATEGSTLEVTLNGMGVESSEGGGGGCAAGRSVPESLAGVGLLLVALVLGLRLRARRARG